MRTIGGISILALLASVVAGCSYQEEGDAVLLPVPEDPTVTLKVWFRAGSMDDPPGKEGLAFLTGQLISEGSTTNRSYEDILQALYPLASSYFVRVDREMTVLSGRTHVDNLDEFYALLTDAYLRPAFSEEDFQRLKTDQLNYLRNQLRYAQDEELGKAALYSFVFDGTRYAHPPQGNVQAVESLSVDDVREFYRKHYTRDSATVALGGGFESALVDRFRGSLSELPAGPAGERPSIETAAIEGRQVLLVDKPDADASISFGFPVSVRRGEREFYALWIANSWLGEHRNSSSHLYQVIRGARGMNYGDYSYIESFPNGGRRSFPPTHVGREHQIFEVWIRTLPNEQAHFALRAAMRELNGLIENGLTEEQFRLTRDFLKKYILHFADTTSARLGYAVDDRFYGIDGDGHLARFRKMMDEISRDEVNATVRKHLQTANVKIAMVTGQAEALRGALEGDTPTPMTYKSDKPAEVLEEDKAIAVFSMPVEAAKIRVVPVDSVFER